MADIHPTYFGIAAVLFTAASMLPQLVKIIRDKKADDIYVPMLLILFSGLILWIIYGTMKNDLPIIVTNAFSLAVNVVIIIFTLKYKKKNTN